MSPSRRDLLRGGVGLLAARAWARQPERAPKAMVVSQEPHATDVGVAALQAGGNAVDAAIATAFALAVTLPQAGNLGGGGFLLVRMADGRATFFDFREKAPAAATRDMYLDAQGNLTRDSLVGPRAAGVPGTVRGLEMAHRKLGRARWGALVEPAARLAKDGFPISYGLADSLERNKLLAQFPESRRVFQGDGTPLAPLARLRQPELGKTLERIRKGGAGEFYEGETARTFAKYMAEAGGHITVADLKAYQAVEREPLTGRYKDCDLLCAPPPSSGGIGVLQMLAMLAGSGYEASGAGAAATYHYLAEVMRRYYADRSEHLADPDFHRVPVSGLLDPAYVATRRASIDRERAGSSTALRPGTPGVAAEKTETTHLSVVDSEGNCAALTYTLNGGFGNGVTVPGLGFLLNNEMDDFAAKPGAPNLFGLVQGEANRIEPGKRPLSSMTPTIVTKTGKPFLVLGAPGGSRIINGVFQVFLNVVDFGMNLQEAVDHPRCHHQWLPDKLYLERGISPDTAALLRARGHDVVENGGGVALVEAVMVDEAGTRHGACDGRAEGGAAGY